MRKRRGNWEVSVGEKGIRLYYQAVGDAPGGDQREGELWATANRGRWTMDRAQAREKRRRYDDQPCMEDYQTVPNTTKVLRSYDTGLSFGTRQSILASLDRSKPVYW